MRGIPVRNWTMAAVAAAALTLTGCSLLSGVVDVEALQLTQGECVNEPSVTEEGEQEIGVLPVVDCEQPHYGEVYYTVDLTDEEIPDAMPEQAEAICGDEFAGFVGIAYENSRYYYTAIYPTPTTGSAGDRQVACVIVGDVGEQLTGSAEGSAA